MIDLTEWLICLVILAALWVFPTETLRMCHLIFEIAWRLLVIVLLGIPMQIDDYFYNRKVKRGEASFRLPWSLRLSGWEVGSGNPEVFETNIYPNPHTDKLETVRRRKRS